MTKPMQPLRSRSLIRTCDLDEARAGVRALYGDVALYLDGDAAAFEWRADLIRLGPMALVRHLVKGEVRLFGTTESYVITMGRGRDALVITPMTHGEARIGGEAAITDIIIDPRFVRAQLEALTLATLRDDVRFELLLSLDSGPGAMVERLMVYLAGEAGAGSEVLHHPLVTTSLCEALVRALLLGHPHDHAHLFGCAGELPPLASVVVTHRAGAWHAPITRREREVCELVARGVLNKQIAAELGISLAVVKQHRARGMKRLGVSSAAELARLVERVGEGRGLPQALARRPAGEVALAGGQEPTPARP